MSVTHAKVSAKSDGGDATKVLPSEWNAAHAGNSDFALLVAASDASAKSLAAADYVCDGTADDVQIQAAIDALPTAGGVVLLSDGTFTITTKLTLRGQMILRGTGQFGSVIVASGCDGLYFAPGITSWPDDEQYITLQDFGVRGDYTAAKVGIYLEDTKHFLVERVLVEMFASHGIHVTDSYINTIRDCTSRYNDGDGIFLDHGVNVLTIEGCSCRQNNGAGIGMLGTAGSKLFDVWVIGGAMESNCVAGVDVRDYVNDVYISTFFERNKTANAGAGRTVPTAPVVGYNIILSSGGVSATRGATIVNCNFADIKGSGGTGYDIYIRHGQGVHISGNHHAAPATKAVKIDAGGVIQNIHMPDLFDAYLDTTMPRSGSSTLNGTTGRTITHNIDALSDYVVAITPAATLAGRWYITKSVGSFVVYSTEAGDAGAFDWAILMDSI